MLKPIMNFFKRPLGVICLLAFLFIVPLFMAFWLAEKKPAGQDTTNHGLLITPPLAFSRLPLLDLEGDPITNKQLLGGHWLLLYVSPFPCEKVCREKLYFLRQIETATGKDRNRIERVLMTFIDRPGAKDLPKLLRTEYAGTIHVNTESAAYFDLVRPLLRPQLAELQGYIYIVDPHGNILMIYKPTTPPMDIFKDLTHLLEASQIG